MNWCPDVVRNPRLPDYVRGKGGRYRSIPVRGSNRYEARTISGDDGPGEIER